jgi:hypothetical protein
MQRSNDAKHREMKRSNDAFVQEIRAENKHSIKDMLNQDYDVQKLRTRTEAKLQDHQAKRALLSMKQGVQIKVTATCCIDLALAFRI